MNYEISGESIVFGHYEQDDDSTRKEPITWRVLIKSSSGQYLIVSEKALDVKQYNTRRVAITWEKSTIRSWLNGYDASYNTDGIDYTKDNFIDTAFNAEEKAKIIATTVTADINPRYNYASPGNETTDKIFLLSILEANLFFTSDNDRQADATTYAIKHGAMVYGSESHEYTSNGSCKDTHCYAHNTLLRTPGSFDQGSAYVKYDGYIIEQGNNVDATYTVRPALWVQW